MSPRLGLDLFTSTLGLQFVCLIGMENVNVSVNLKEKDLGIHPSLLPRKTSSH